MSPRQDEPHGAPGGEASTDFATLLLQGALYCRSGDHQDAVRVLRRAIHVDPTSVDARRLLGLSLGVLGDLEAAEAELHMVLALSPGDRAARKTLARLRGQLRPPSERWWHHHRNRLAAAGTLVAGAAVVLLAVSGWWGFDLYRTGQLKQRVADGRVLLKTTQTSWNRTGKSEPDPAKLQPLLKSSQEASSLLKGQAEAAQAQALAAEINTRVQTENRKAQQLADEGKRQLDSLKGQLTPGLPDGALRRLRRAAEGVRARLAAAWKSWNSPALQAGEQAAVALVKRIDEAPKVVVDDPPPDPELIRMDAERQHRLAREQFNASADSLPGCRRALRTANAATGHWNRYCRSRPEEGKEGRDESTALVATITARIRELVQVDEPHRQANAKAEAAKRLLDRLDRELPSGPRNNTVEILAERKRNAGDFNRAERRLREALRLDSENTLAQEQQARIEKLRARIDY